MDAKEIIAAHRGWKDKFRTAMATREILDLDIIGSDCCCEFGHWLHTDARREFGHLAAYQDCVDCHAEFHVEAARVAILINQGRLFIADRMMAAGTPYATLSERLSMSVIALLNATACEALVA
jgi:methyl-accepting chemotaxis protein